MEIVVKNGVKYSKEYVGSNCDACPYNSEDLCNGGYNASPDCGYEYTVLEPLDTVRYEKYMSMWEELPNLLRREKEVVKRATELRLWETNNRNRTLHLEDIPLNPATLEVVKEVAEYFGFYNGLPYPVQVRITDRGETFYLEQCTYTATFFTKECRWE